MKYVYKKKAYIFLVLIFDIIGGILFSFRFIFGKPVPKNPKNILVVRLDHVGDFVCTTPLFINLRKKFPEAKIIVLMNSISKDLAHRNPNIDKVITFSPFYLARDGKSSFLKGLIRVVKDIRNIGFDLGIEPRGDIVSILLMWLGGIKYCVGYGITGGGFLLHKECRYNNNIHVIDRNLLLLKDLGIRIDDRSPDIYFNDKDIAFVDGIMKDKKIEGKDSAIVLHPFAGAEARKWSKDKFQDLIDRLKSNGISTFLIGTNNDVDSYADVVDMRGKFNLPQLAYFIKKIGYFIGLNSGPANIAAALRVSSIVISSGTNIIEQWIPNNSNVRFVYKLVECRPCERKTCRKKEHLCMNAVSVDDIMAMISMDWI